MTLLVLPDRVRRAESRLPSDAAAFLAGMTPAETFRAQRVPQGLYKQRTTGTYMLRLRLPGGMITARQAAGLARLTGAQDCRRLHLTTRLAIQCHDLPLETAVAIHQGLADLGLSSRGTGGNTVRNVTADPLAGVAPDYEVLQHGHLGAPSAIAQQVGTVPAKRIPDLLVAVARGGDLGAEVARHAVLPVVIPRDWFHDWGDTQAFSLAGLGEGECAAG